MSRDLVTRDCGGGLAFLCFEGVDGVGKTTQIDLFRQWLGPNGREIVVCRDPGGTPLGEQLRELLLARKDLALAPRAELLLYMASRAQLVSEVIRPALARGALVISDRYLLANLAYQCYAGDNDLEQARSVGRVATDGLLPDLTFLLDMPAKQARERRGEQALDRMESRGVDYLESVRQGYREEQSAWPAPVAIIDAAQPQEDVHRDIREHYLRHFPE